MLGGSMIRPTVSTAVAEGALGRPPLLSRRQVLGGMAGLAAFAGFAGVVVAPAPPAAAAVPSRYGRGYGGGYR